MALGAFTIEAKVKQGPIHADLCTFAGDGAYPAGGTPDFTAAYKAGLEAAGRPSPGREVLGVVQVDAAAQILRYNKAEDKLMVFQEDLTEATGDLSATTFQVLILSV